MRPALAANHNAPRGRAGRQPNLTQPVPGRAADYFFKCASNHPITVWYHNTLLAGFNTQ
jgi:hypothetical protein